MTSIEMHPLQARSCARLQHPAPTRHGLRLGWFMAGMTALVAGHAAAQAWRCGASYADRPCGTGERIEIADPRDTVQRQAALRSTQEAKNAADRLERERLRLEASAPRATVITDAARSGVNAPAVPPPLLRPNGGKPRRHKEEAFKAQAPSAPNGDKAAARSKASGSRRARSSNA